MSMGLVWVKSRWQLVNARVDESSLLVVKKVEVVEC